MTLAEQIVSNDPLTVEEGVALLEQSGRMGDNEIEHMYADKVLLKFVPAEIREAYETISKRFWYA